MTEREFLSNILESDDEKTHEAFKEYLANNKTEFEKYTEEQIEEMNKHKWIESEKAKHDLGNAALLDWIEKYAAKFREEWEEKHGPVI